MISGRRSHLLALAVASGVVAFAPLAVADEASCIEASEKEIGLRKEGRLRAALQELAVCAAPGCSAEVRTECGRRIALLDAALPSLVLRATDASGNDLVDVSVKLDDAPVANALDGRALSVDPGSHRLRFEAPGKPSVDKTIMVVEGEKGRVVSVVMDLPRPTEPVVVPSVPVSPEIRPSVVVATTPAETRQDGPWRTVGWVTGGVGVAGVVVGAIFGGVAASKVGAAKGECHPSCSSNTNEVAASDMNTAGTFADVSTGAFIVGGVVALTGVVLVLTGGPKNAPTALQKGLGVVASGHSFALGGSW